MSVVYHGALRRVLGLLAAWATFSCAELVANGTHDGRCAAMVGQAAAAASLQALSEALASMDLADALACAKEALSFEQQQPVAVANLLEGVAAAPACAAELASKSEMQSRCAQTWYKIAITTLLNAGEEVKAEAMWKRAVELRPSGKDGPARIRWPSVMQIPTVWIPSLRSLPVWDCATWPFVSALEAAAGRILQEMKAAAQSFGPAYPYLSQRGTWEYLFLFRGGRWNEELCNIMETTCHLLIPEIPTKPNVPYAMHNNEEVVVFRSKPGTSVGQHAGAANNQVNIHLTLAGASSAKLNIAGAMHQLEDGKALCFQDSYVHSVEHRGGDERLSLVIRVLHPEASLADYGAADRTDVIQELGNWDEKAALVQEVARLRHEYRRLVLKGVLSHKATLQTSDNLCEARAVDSQVRGTATVNKQ